MKLEAEILLNRFRCNAQLIKLGDGGQHDYSTDAQHSRAQIHEPERAVRLRGTYDVPRDTNTVHEKQDSGDHLSNLTEQKQERAEEHGASRDDRQKRELEEIERGIAEALESQCA